MIKKSLIVIWNEVWLLLFKSPIYHPKFWDEEREKSKFLNKYGFTDKLRALFSGFNSDKHVLYDLKHNKKYYLSDIRRRILSERISKKHFYIVHNKIVFNKYIESKCNTIPKLALLRKGAILNIQGNDSIKNIDDVISLVINGPGIFLKPNDGGSGRGIFKIEKSPEDSIFRCNEEKFSKREIVDLLNSLNGYILEEKFTQTGLSNTFYPKTLNTLRIYTMVEPVTGKVVIPIALHRIGTSKSIFADNWSQGGLSVWIDSETGIMGNGVQYPFDGVLKQYENHPDTGVKLKDQLIPNWEYIKSEVLRCAEYLYFMPWLGWDVVLSDDEVYILEANYNPDVNLVQVHEPLLKDPRLKNFFKYHNVI